MTLDAYLKARGESEEKFAKRAKISRATVFRVKKSGVAGSFRIAGLIVNACGGALTLADLMVKGDAPAKRRAKRSAA